MRDILDETGFRHAFHSAISAYKNGCIPVGCSIIDIEGNLISKGENSQYSNTKGEPITEHPLAHAEINAILKTNAYKHSNIKSYTLYTTLEPCPLCFGAIVMGCINNVQFAALDKYNDFSRLNNSVEFISKQNVQIRGPFDRFQSIQIALIVCRRLEKGFDNNEALLNVYKSYCNVGVQLGFYLQNDIYFHQLLSSDQNEDQIYNYLLSCT